MRTVLWLLAAVAVAVAQPALAAKKKSAPALLSVVVLPFVGKGAGGSQVKEALDAALDAHAHIIGSDVVSGDLDKAGAAAFDKKNLASILAAHGIDVIVRGERAGKRVNVTAYGKDGAARFAKDFALITAPEDAAKEIATALVAALSSWKTLEPLSADDDDASTTAAANDDPPAKRKSARAGLDFGADDGDAPAAAAPPKHHASIDDDAAAPASAKAAHKESIDDVVNAPKANEQLRHSFAISAALDGDHWHYHFTGKSPSIGTDVGVALYPGESALVDVWPLAFAGVRFFGLDADIGAGSAAVDLGSAFTPGKFLAEQLHYGASAKLRYTFDNGIGIGARIGYRFITAGAESQTVDVGGTPKSVTLAPGYFARALAVGADAFFPFMLADRRVELEARGEILPLATYEEVPDNPGSSSTAFGWHALAAARCDIVAGFYVEDRFETTGLSVAFNNKGTRHAIEGNEVVTVDGGTALNYTAAFSLGVGFMF